MSYVIMGRKISGGWTYPEMNDHGDIPNYPTEAAATEQAKRLNRERGNGDLVVVPRHQSSDYYQYGCPQKG